MKDQFARLWAPLICFAVPVFGISYDAYAGNVTWTIFWGVVILAEVILHACDRITAEIRRATRQSPKRTAVAS